MHPASLNAYIMLDSGTQLLTSLQRISSLLSGICYERFHLAVFMSLVLLFTNQTLLPFFLDESA
jgi:hypothetical protein